MFNLRRAGVKLLSMSSTTQRPPQHWREARRCRAWELHQAGWKQKTIAAALGVTPSAVSHWLKRARAEGVAGLRHRPAPGAAPRLTPAQRAQLPALLARGPAHYGFRGQVWTRARVAAVIEREFGVTYHPAHVSRVLRQIGWTRQKPVRRARQRDEAAVQHWQDERWPQIKRGRSRPAGP
jgi:transposase